MMYLYTLVIGTFHNSMPEVASDWVGVAEVLESSEHFLIQQHNLSSVPEGVSKLLFS